MSLNTLTVCVIFKVLELYSLDLCC